MKRFILILTTICILLSLVTVTSFAWITKGDRYPQSSSSLNSGNKASGFVDKGLPAPIVSDPVPNLVPGRINIKLNGELVYFYEKPLMVNDRVLLPFRELFEFFEMSVTWDNETRTAIAKNDETQIKITVDSDIAYVNNNEKTLDVPAVIINERTYVPLRFVAESLGYTVGWDGRSQIVNIYTSGGGVR